MQNKWKESLQGLSIPGLNRKGKTGNEDENNGESRDSALRNMKRDELLEILVEVYRENETLKEKLAETEERLKDYKQMLEQSSAMTERFRALEESQKEQMELLHKLTAGR